MGVWFFCLIGVPLVSAETPEFKLSAGDRVLLVGGGVLARDAHTGYLETELLRRFPKQAVLVRNTAESGESLLDDTEQEFARFQRDLEILRPTVVLIGFGWEDSRRGVDKLADFLAKYGKRLDAVAAQKARAVLVSPIRHEDLGGDRPDPKEHNQALRAYVDGIAHLAQSRHLPFVNLFDFLAVPPGGPARGPSPKMAPICPQPGTGGRRRWLPNRSAIPRRAGPLTSTSERERFEPNRPKSPRSGRRRRKSAF